MPTPRRQDVPRTETTPPIHFVQVFTRESHLTPACRLIVGYAADGDLVLGAEEPAGASALLWQLCLRQRLPRLPGVTLAPRAYARLRAAVRAHPGVVWTSTLPQAACS